MQRRSMPPHGRLYGASCGRRPSSATVVCGLLGVASTALLVKARPLDPWAGQRRLLLQGRRVSENKNV